MSYSRNAVRCAMRGKLAVALLACAPFTASLIAGCSASDPQTLIAKANAHMDRNEYRAAVIELKNVLAANPDNAEARYRLGVAYDQASEPALAVAELKRALDLGYDADQVLPKLGATLLDSAQYQKLLDELKTANSANPKVKAEIWVLQGQAHIELGQIKEGRALMERAFASEPDVPRVLLAHARLAATDRRPDLAATYIERAIANAPGNTDAWVMKGDLLQVSRDNPGASAAYAKAVELNPHNVSARLGAAMTAIERRAFDEARKHVDYVRKNHPGSLMGVYAQGLLEYRQGNLPAARDAVAQILKVAPDHLPTLLLAGTIDAAMGTYAQAQARLERVMDAAPGYLAARKTLIAVLAQSGQVQRARDLVATALKQAPKDAGLLRLAGELDMRSGDFANAATYFEKAVTSEPRNAIVRTRLGMSRLALGETDRGLSDLGAAAEMDTQSYQADAAIIASHLRAGRYDDALNAVLKLEEKQPKNPFTYNLKAAVYISKKDVANARKYLEHALELQPTYIPAAMSLAVLDLHDKNPKAARGRLETILQKDEGNVQALLSLAELGPRIGATEKEQVDWLQRAAKMSPGLVEPRIQLAAHYMRVGNPKNAVEAAEQAQTLKPDDARVLDTLGYAQLAAGQKERALATYSKLAASQPDSPFALNRLAMAQAANADASAAAATLKKALTVDPGYIPASMSLVNLHMHAGRHAEALKVAQQAEKEKPNSGAGYMLEGDVLMAEKKFAQAVKAYERALSKDKNPVIVMKLYSANISAGNSGEAEARFAQWLKDSPDDVVVRTYIAERSMQSGDWQRAIGLYEWLQQNSPDNVAVLNNLAWAYQQVRDARALAMAERAYNLQPQNAAAADTLGWILLQRGDSARAFKVLEKASAAAPKVDGIRLHLAQAAFKSGDKARARQELDRLTASGSNIVQQSEARDLLQQLDR